jgi:chitin disaccharide deacetylase
MKKLLFLLVCLMMVSGWGWCAEEKSEDEKMKLWDDEKIRLVVRLDDVGFCHASNVAFKKIAENGIVSAVSVMVNTPWLDEAVELLKEHPEVSVGVHTCFNSEWTPYRWGPVSPVNEVPSLVDEWGKFFGMKKTFVENEPNLDEFEKELRAQVDLALKKGLNVSYMDHHMGTAVATPLLKDRFAEVAKDYDLAISRWFGEDGRITIYSVPPEEKADSLLEQVGALDAPGTYLIVCHPGLDVPEMAVLKDVHPWAPQNVSEHRQAETDALCDSRLKALIEEKGIEVVGYDVIRARFMDKMADPERDFYGTAPK